jgi:lipoprotein-releasing system ATP-binding protein
MSEPAGAAANSQLPLELVEVTKGYFQGPVRIEVLRGVSLALRPGELGALVGPSGTGKSTLLHIAGLLDRPESGEVRINGQVSNGLDDDRRTRLRREYLGFVYQFHHLFAEFTALENVVLPQMVAGIGKREAGERAARMLARLGLAERLHHRPSELSGGEQQRVAIARAVANRPSVLLADEPTGNLDSRTADAVFAELESLAREQGLAMLIATHNREIAARMDQVWELRDGMIHPG